ncbi:polyprenyl synthetase family protein [Helicobacter fennelliae]|uniref:Octaprenyl diphosphate synthase n=1 Tax=Helicobacter fennelliae MRY12-0050 TaxID=1325130 RepID=T1D0M9_9HELI|nr:polyprenyl synthetase family protein [Helicobacter fennelliae]GAD19775.1 octaprenyl diphosphate synthase [Helicobacter fennelliae MRY12-0050]STP08031.1 octaprenyl-diphosphate synthase [Helicobacter fennelliae]
MLEKVKNRCDKWIAQLQNPHISTMYNAIASGKMLRSKLILAIIPPESNPHKHDQIIDLCAIIELIQCASLLHDDVIDDALVRRGNESINASFGNKNAIMLGDVLYSSAYAKLCEFDKQIAQYIAQCVSDLSIGEVNDVFYAHSFQSDLEIYYQILEQKTAALIKACTKSAAILANLNHAQYEEYGKNLGIGFQIIDDILDITQDSQTLGKPNMNDLREGKSTLAFILLYHKLPLNQRQTFLDAFKRADSSDIEWFRFQFKTHNIIHESKQIAKDFINKAIKAIENENNPRLIEVAHSMIQRSF